MISALDIAQQIYAHAVTHNPNAKFETPTDEQRKVIEFDGVGNALVIAGAGSGKTTTMAQRVVWLVANGIVEPSEILGLTFTRKAAASLRGKVASQLDHYAGPAPSGISLTERALGLPTVSTYNAFASRVFQENALVVGREPDAVLLSDAAAWELAYGVARDLCDERFIPFGKSLNAIVSALLRMARGINDHDVDRQRMIEVASEFVAVQELPVGSRSKAALLPDLKSPVQAMQALPLLLELVEEYERRKRSQSYIEYSDQVALANQAVRKYPGIADTYRQQYKVVLLDEYQDTSVLQAEFLSALFADQQVMAVGDPFQAIYGWRGASSDALADFPIQFGPCEQFSLSQSWRNDQRILDTANVLAEPLRETAPVGVTVKKLGARDNVGIGAVELDWLTTTEDEAHRVANWMAANVTEHTEAAVLFRERSQMAKFSEALTAAHVPNVIIGFEAVLESPEIVDLVAALNVIDDVSAGAELIRLLAGARWRIGLADLQALQELSHTLASQNMDGTRVSKDIAAAQRSSIDEADMASIVDALDYLASASDDNWRLEPFSPEGLPRLKSAGLWLRSLRRSMTKDLGVSVRKTITALGLVTELYANPRRVDPMSNIDAFLGLVDDYTATVSQPTLGGLLSWVNSSNAKVSFETVEIDPEPGVVQLLTIHAAKGLEWDIVALPRLIQDVFPSKTKDVQGGFGFGAVPYAVRGDRKALPQFSPRGFETQKEVLDGLAAHKDDLRDMHHFEERRVAYVAFTRAKKALLLTGAWYRGTSRASQPSEYFVEAAETFGIDIGPWDADHAPAVEETDDAHTEPWPFDPLRGHRDAIEAAAAFVDEVPEQRVETPDQRMLDILLAERAERVDLTLPERFRVPASQFHELVRGDERTLINAVRPLPQRPYRASRLGTMFHAWVEQHYGMAGSVELVDDTLFNDDEAFGSGALDAASAAALEQLQSTFLASPWAGRKPFAVELELTTFIAGVRFACKLDAVFATDDGYEIVDWKTGQAPVTEEEHHDRALQLALYRIALAKHLDIDPSTVRACLYYVANNTVIAPTELPDEAAIAELWEHVATMHVPMSAS